MPKTTRKPSDAQEEPRRAQKSSDLVLDMAEDTPRYYSNHVVSRISPFDLELLFGELVKQGVEFSARPLVSVMLSPQHAKAIARLMAAQVAKYEDNYGPIPDIATLREEDD